MPRRPRAVATGDRVYVRAPAETDRAEFLQRVRDSSRLHRPWAKAPGDHDAFTAYLRRGRSENAEHLLVCRIEDHAIAGVFNVNEIVRGNFRSAFLGYYAFEPFAGQGYMTEGLLLVLRHAFETLGLHRVEANVQPANVASTALVQRAGFRLEGFSARYLKVAGRWRDHERWAITVEDWRDRPRRPTRRRGGRA